MKLLTIFKLIISILPTLIDAVKLIEAAIPERGKGSEKLEATRTILEASYLASTDITVSFEALWPPLKKTISGVVNTFNATGVFSKK